MLVQGKKGWFRAIVELLESSGVASYEEGFPGVVLRVPEWMADSLARELEEKYLRNEVARG